MVISHFVVLGKLKGFRGSLGINSTTNGSWSVPEPAYGCFRTSGVTRDWEATMRKYDGRLELTGERSDPVRVLEEAASLETPS